MAAALKDQFGPAVAREIARMVRATHARFDDVAFLRDALRGYMPLSLTQRARHIAAALRSHLPQDAAAAIEILRTSARQQHAHAARHGMAGFLFLPHTCFIADYGLEHFEVSMQALHELTQRFTAEFSIRAFIERHPERTLERLHHWTNDPSHHVRRLVSEGTRPRLPWAPRLRAFQRDPAPVLELLERLRDDPELYVRRSVANNLNDIGKDHPDLLTEVATRWLRDATEERRWIVRHALRSALKRGETGALRTLGYGESARCTIDAVRIAPARVRIGGGVRIEFDVVSAAGRDQSLMVDLVVHYVKAGGKTRAKTFKLSALQLAVDGRVRIGKTLSLAQMSTRTHYPGLHRVEAMVNGTLLPLGEFRVLR